MNCVQYWPPVLWLLCLISALFNAMPVLPQEVVAPSETLADLVNALCLDTGRRAAAEDPQAELRREMRRWNTVDRLVRMGTNAWPAVPALVAAMNHPDFGVAAAAAEALGEIEADRSPGWTEAQGALYGRTNAFYAFRWLAFGRDRFSRRFDLGCRRFGMVGLRTVGPVAAPCVSHLKSVIHSKEEHELWPPAVAALRALGTEPGEVISELRERLSNREEHPTVRVSAAEALAVAGVKDPDTLTLLRATVHDESSHVRVAAARALWKLDATPEEVLPVLAPLLHHKLVSVRTAALKGLAEMGPAAASTQSAILELTEDANQTVREAAQDALICITDVQSRNAHEHPGSR